MLPRLSRHLALGVTLALGLLWPLLAGAQPSNPVTPSHVICDSGCAGAGGTQNVSVVGITYAASQFIGHIICDSGCGSPPASADKTAFTFGTTNVSPIAFVVDDVATDAVAENSYGAARMSGSRVLYIDLSKSPANTNAFLVSGTVAVSGSVAVTGAFFQATQPVSGTFWQTTQPVSIASMPSTPVTGTFWQATQPVSGTFWQATQPVSIASMPSTPVTGTFFQATQPISAASLPLPTGASTEATLALMKTALDAVKVDVDKIPASPATEGGNLATIATNTTSIATAANQTTGNNSLNSIDGKLTTENTNSTVLATVAGTPGSAAPTRAELTAGIDALGITRTVQTTPTGMLVVLMTPAPSLPLPICNPVRRYACQPKGF